MCMPTTEIIMKGVSSSYVSRVPRRRPAGARGNVGVRAKHSENPPTTNRGVEEDTETALRLSAPMDKAQ